MKNYTDAELVSKAKEKILAEAEALKAVSDEVDEAYAKTIKAIDVYKRQILRKGDPGDRRDVIGPRLPLRRDEQP